MPTALYGLRRRRPHYFATRGPLRVHCLPSVKKILQTFLCFETHVHIRTLTRGILLSSSPDALNPYPASRFLLCDFPLPALASCTVQPPPSMGLSSCPMRISLYRTCLLSRRKNGGYHVPRAGSTSGLATSSPPMGQHPCMRRISKHNLPTCHFGQCLSSALALLR